MKPLFWAVFKRNRVRCRIQLRFRVDLRFRMNLWPKLRPIRIAVQLTHDFDGVRDLEGLTKDGDLADVVASVLTNKNTHLI